MSENFYFAYGSNLDISQMEKRIGKCIILERVHADGYKLVFNVKSDNWGRLESGLEQKNVKAYIWPKEEPSHEPPEAYRNAIIKGLTQHGYTQDIIEKVQKEFSQS